MEGIALECRDRLVIHQPKGNSCQIAPSFTVKLYSDPRVRTDTDSNPRSPARGTTIRDCRRSTAQAITFRDRDRLPRANPCATSKPLGGGDLSMFLSDGRGSTLHC